jgi:hypothetical protein
MYMQYINYINKLCGIRRQTSELNINLLKNNYGKKSNT